MDNERELTPWAMFDWVQTKRSFQRESMNKDGL